MADDHWEIPYEHIAGSYANAFSLWHTAHEFTIDFGARTREPTTVQAVARIRFPRTLMFDLLTAINDDLTVYEDEWGEIVQPRPAEGGEDA
jgi:hypothetical protein